MRKSCSCKNIGPFDICEICVQIKYLLNFHVYKLCVKIMPENITPHVVPLNQYLQNEITKCEPFFTFLKIRTKQLLI